MVSSSPYQALPNAFRAAVRSHQADAGRRLFQFPGNASHPDVQQAIAHVFERAKAGGKPCGILAPVQQDAERYLAMGSTLVAVCADMGLLRNAAQGVKKHFMQA